MTINYDPDRKKKPLAKSPERFSLGIKTAILGLVVNLLLSGLKIYAGLATHAIAIIADAVNNLTDAVVVLITIAGIRLSAMPPDAEHPYGHGRIEYLTGLVIAAGIIFAGGQIGYEAVNRIIEPQPLNTDGVAFAILISTILVKFFLGRHYGKIAAKINSASIQSLSGDSYSDCWGTSAIIVSIILYKYFSLNLDGIFGFIGACLIVATGYNAAKSAITPLIGSPPDTSLVEKMGELIIATPKVYGYHDLLIHSYGPAQSFATVHVTLPAELGLMEAHTIIDDLENKIHDELQIEVVIHVDPVQEKDI